MSGGEVVVAGQWWGKSVHGLSVFGSAGNWRAMTRPSLVTCKPHSFLSSCSHHQRPARSGSPGVTARVQGAHPTDRKPRSCKALQGTSWARTKSTACSRVQSNNGLTLIRRRPSSNDAARYWRGRWTDRRATRDPGGGAIKRPRQRRDLADDATVETAPRQRNGSRRCPAGRSRLRRARCGRECHDTDAITALGRGPDVIGLREIAGRYRASRRRP